MDRMLYVAMSGAKQTLHAKAANSHNLANATTTGFRADLSQLRSLPVFGPGHPSRVHAMTERPGIDLRPGTVQTTGRDLDVALDGAGFLAVQAPDGSEAYTRAGDLHIGPNGVLINGAGHPVLGNAGPIGIPPAEKLEIGVDGTLSVRLPGQGANALVELDRLRLVRPDEARLRKGEDGLFRLDDGAVAPADAAVKLVPGALEGSNVNAVEAMVEMISLARRFEMQVRMMRVAEENDAAAAQLLRPG